MTDGTSTQGATAPFTTEDIKAELDYIGRAGDGADLSGIAFSGGGIRSAAFCLGVAQALQTQFGRFHYLSTVSGGGYTGSALTWLNFLGRPHRLDRLAKYLRSRGNYLDPNKRLNALSLVGIVLRTMVINLGFYLGALVLIFALARRLFRPDGPLAFLAEAWPAGNPALAVSVAAGATFVLWSIAYGVGTGLVSQLPDQPPKDPTKLTPRQRLVRCRYRERVAFQQMVGRLIAFALIMAVAGSLPFAEAALPHWLADSFAKGVAGGIGALFGAAQALAQFLKNKAGRDSDSWLTSPVAVWVSAGLALYGVALLADVAAIAIVDGRLPAWPVAGVVVVLGLFANVNLVTPHRMYRDRLMEAFLPSPTTLDNLDSQPADFADRTPLTAMCQGKGPLHLINTNVVLVDSDNPVQRGRGGANFVLSPVWCGGDATGWFSAAKFAGTHGDALTLATAMAISGAAVNAHCGVAGQGPTRNALVSMLLALFGLQLGYWVRRPAGRRGRGTVIPNLLRPGLNSLFGFGFREDAGFLMLSDGGHFENLGLYELVRRRLRTIVVVDGSADPEFRFGDLGTSIERVYADFGAVVEFVDDRRHSTLGRLRPRTGDGYPALLGLAEAGWVRGTVRYPATDGKPVATGDIYYLKSVLVDGLPESVFAYKSANSAFPHQDTADQFFDEEQLEAYRRLGAHLGASLAEVLAERGGVQ